MTSRSGGDKRHRFPPAMIAHAARLYFRFPLSLRLEMLLERGVVVSYETVRRWAMKFGRDYARRLKRKRASRRDIWRLLRLPDNRGSHCRAARPSTGRVFRKSGSATPIDLSAANSPMRMEKSLD